MIYSQKGRVLFTHVSRTAGVAITQCLRRSLPDASDLLGQHDPLSLARPLLGRDFDDAFKFAIVRNPWDRFVSWYALIGQVEYRDSVEPANVADPSWRHWRDFDEFLETWAADKIEVDGVERRRLSQWAQLSDANGDLLVNDIGRFETLADDCTRLFKRVGLEWGSPKAVNASHHYHYSVYYSDFAREFVADAYADDVFGFDYQFESTTAGD